MIMASVVQVWKNVVRVIPVKMRIEKRVINPSIVAELFSCSGALVSMLAPLK